MISYIIQYYFDIMKIIRIITSYMKYAFLFTADTLRFSITNKFNFL